VSGRRERIGGIGRPADLIDLTGRDVRPGRSAGRIGWSFATGYVIRTRVGAVGLRTEVTAGAEGSSALAIASS
jgi:hypothetical protein